MAKKKILVVDDEKGFTDMIKLNLEATNNYDVCVENVSRNALGVAMQFKPDLILLDVIMPDFEGPEVARLLKDHDVLCRVPIIFLTATITREEVDSLGGIVGGHPFISKPCEVDDLVSAIEGNISLGN